jgi:hypothetical protein
VGYVLIYHGSPDSRTIDWKLAETEAEDRASAPAELERQVRRYFEGLAAQPSPTETWDEIFLKNSTNG